MLRGYVEPPGGMSGVPTQKAMTSARWAAVVSLSAVIGAIAVGVPALAPADSGCPNDLVPRDARPGDQVCVTKEVAAEIAQENANAASLREPKGGAYGPNTCKSGYVWREAFDGDAVCVVPQRRQETWSENAGAGYGPTGGAPSGTKPPGVTVPVRPCPGRTERAGGHPGAADAGGSTTRVAGPITSAAARWNLIQCSAKRRDYRAPDAKRHDTVTESQGDDYATAVDDSEEAGVLRSQIRRVRQLVLRCGGGVKDIGIQKN